jgi:hypothetical protein
MAEEWKSNDLANFFRKIMKQTNKNYYELLFPVLKKYPLNVSKFLFKGIKLELLKYIQQKYGNEMINITNKNNKNLTQEYDTTTISIIPTMIEKFNSMTLLNIL